MSKLLIKMVTVISVFISCGVIVYQLCTANSNMIQYNDYIYYEEGLKEEEASLVDESYVKRLPPVLKTKFLEDGWKVRIIKDSDSLIAGHTDINTKTVTIKTGYEKDVLFHEFAHIYLHENPVGSEFEEIYEEEGQSMIDAYFTNDNYYYKDMTEYYCTAWNIVFTLGRNNDKYNAGPKSFEYFSNLFDRLYSE